MILPESFFFFKGEERSSKKKTKGGRKEKKVYIYFNDSKKSKCYTIPKSLCRMRQDTKIKKIFGLEKERKRIN